VHDPEHAPGTVMSGALISLSPASGQQAPPHTSRLRLQAAALALGSAVRYRAGRSVAATTPPSAPRRRDGPLESHPARDQLPQRCILGTQIGQHGDLWLDAAPTDSGQGLSPWGNIGVAELEVGRLQARTPPGLLLVCVCVCVGGSSRGWGLRPCSFAECRGAGLDAMGAQPHCGRPALPAQDARPAAWRLRGQGRASGIAVQRRRADWPQQGHTAALCPGWRAWGLPKVPDWLPWKPEGQWSRGRVARGPVVLPSSPSAESATWASVLQGGGGAGGVLPAREGVYPDPDLGCVHVRGARVGAGGAGTRGSRLLPVLQPLAGRGRGIPPSPAPLRWSGRYCPLLPGAGHHLGVGRAPMPACAGKETLGPRV
jgi:hypothetical protein